MNLPSEDRLDVDLDGCVFELPDPGNPAMIAETPQVRIVSLRRPFHVESPFGGETFVALVWNCDPWVTVEEREEVSRALVAAGCRFACCAGELCDKWEYDFDCAHLERDPDYQPRDEWFVMTTSHVGETPADLAFYLRYCTFINERDATRFLVLLIDADRFLETALRQALNEEFGPNSVP